MTLEGAINFNETENYTIYTMNSATTGQYGVVMPKNITGTLNMLVDLHMKGSFDAVGSGAKTKEQLIEEISEEYNKLKSKYADGMLVMPMTDEVMFQSAVTNNDKQKMFDEVKKIGAITSELYKKLTDSGVEKQKIDQKIIIVEKNQDDEKFVTWLKEQMPNFVDGIRYSELTNSDTVTNPFVDSNSIFGPVATEAKPVETEPATPAETVNFGNIFDNPASVQPEAPVEPVASTPVEPVAAPVPEAPIEPEPVVPAAPTVETPAVNNENTSIDIFGIPTDVQGAPVTPNPTTVTPVEPVAPTPVEPVAAPVPEAPVVPEPVVPAAPVVEEPKPVASAPLEGTTTFNPIPNPAPVADNTVAAPAENVEEVVDRPASKGFANLLILLVVLVGVTIASIELGKFLYSVYGA